MPKKRKNRPHGHYCKVCGEYKANEKFSSKGHEIGRASCRERV